ncbi:MAG TPA: outer membrane lipoprotein chaperone LolA [Syntrophales bacterium]|nr:outer membrane lipoprotein chaperone LolA [Syntrophales bacterium]HOI17814.1 outer membrane lipoprotein chaperone LolA [Geobacteraceae bacterium]
MNRQNSISPSNQILIYFMAILASLAASANPVTAAAEETVSLTELVTRLQDSYEKLSDVKSYFVQETTIKSLGKTEREEGEFFFKNPRRMLWNYLKPKAKKLIINPQTTWLYVPDDGVAYVQSTESIMKSRISVKFFSGLAKIQDEFEIRFASPSRVDSQGNYLLDLTAKEPDAALKKLSMTVDRERYVMTQFSFTDAYGNTTLIRLRNIQWNPGLSEGIFSFQPPAGIETVRVP